MSFALPIALTLAALALPIIALYILKVRLRRVPVSTNLFWKQIYEEKPPRSIWQHFRHLLSLLLQLLLLLFIVLAIADPYFSWQLLQARRIVIVVDNSASMRAIDITPTRLDAAKIAALRIVDGLRFRDEVAIVLAGSTPEVVVGMTGHAPTLREAINGIEFSDNPTFLTAAIDLGRRLIGQHPHAQVVVMTDGCVESVSTPESEKAQPASNPAVAGTSSAKESRKLASPANQTTPPESGTTLVEYRLFATETGNVGITQLQVRRSLIDPLGYEILVTVKNASTSPVACRLELTLNDIPVDVIPLKMKPEELWSRSIEKTSLDGGPMRAELTQISAGGAVDGSAEGQVLNAIGGSASSVDPSLANQQSGRATGLTLLAMDSPPGTGGLDALPTDNSAWALLPARKTQKVLVVTRGNLFLQKVFEANPLVEVTVVKEFPVQWPADSIIVLHGQLPATLPSGNVFAIDPIGNCDQWEQGEILENPIVTDQDKASPLMTHIRLDNVVVPQARQLQFMTSPHSLAKTLSGEIVYAEVKRPNGKCLVLSVNLDSSDLAFRTAFPIMVANSLGWFFGTTGELQPSVSTGSVTQLMVSSDAVLELQRSGLQVRTATKPNPDRSGDQSYESRVFATLLSPSMKTSKVSVSGSGGEGADSSIAVVGPLTEVGLWKLTVAHPSADQAVEDEARTVLAEVAVNLANERETDLRPLKQLIDSPQSKTMAEDWFSKPFWFYLVVLACLLTSMEWFLYQRRFIS